MTAPTDPKKEQIHKTLESLESTSVSHEEAEHNAAKTVEVNEEVAHPDANEDAEERVRNRQNAAVNKGSVTH